jgi:hypothetical protein
VIAPHTWVLQCGQDNNYKVLFSTFLAIVSSKRERKRSLVIVVREKEIKRPIAIVSQQKKKS